MKETVMLLRFSRCFIKFLDQEMIYIANRINDVKLYKETCCDRAFCIVGFVW